MFDKVRICFIADKHSLYDDRIYWKMAVPLSKLGYEVHYLLIGDRNESGKTDGGIQFEIIKVKSFSSNRYLNFLLKRLNPGNNYAKLFKKAESIRADIYHFHDLWINRIGGKLKSLEHKPVVFYDAREPYAEDYVSYVKTWTGFAFLISIFAFFVDRWEKRKSQQYDLVIANEETVRKKFAGKIGEQKTAVLYNYTDLLDDYKAVPYEAKKYDLIYCGGISELRGALKILEALVIARKEIPSIQLVFLGQYYPENFKTELERFIVKHDLAQNVHLFDAVSYQKVADFYNASKIGLVLLQPVKTFEISMPIKIFEYMSFGLPIIASNFGHMKDYIQNDSCGTLVDPTNADEIAAVMTELLSNRAIYQRFSENGRKAAMQKYRWELEFEKLLNYYKKALNERK
jgi:glycosyltransferase involved in cell wall biosynthesis